VMTTWKFFCHFGIDAIKIRVLLQKKGQG